MCKTHIDATYISVQGMIRRSRLSPRHGWRGGRHGQGPCPQRIHRFVEPALLLLLHIQPTHGYDLLEGLQNVGFQDYPVDSSVVYRTLRQLEEVGMVISDWDTAGAFGPPRRVYRLTEAGRIYLADWVADLEATDRVLHSFLQAYKQHIAVEDDEHHNESRQ